MFGYGGAVRGRRGGKGVLEGQVFGEGGSWVRGVDKQVVGARGSKVRNGRINHKKRKEKKNKIV